MPIFGIMTITGGLKPKRKPGIPQVRHVYSSALPLLVLKIIGHDPGVGQTVRALLVFFKGFYQQISADSAARFMCQIY
jgi:hypothetical protein